MDIETQIVEFPDFILPDNWMLKLFFFAAIVRAPSQLASMSLHVTQYERIMLHAT
jgi:hypothetical protein